MNYYLTPFIPLSLKGEGEGELEEGYSPLRLPSAGDNFGGSKQERKEEVIQCYGNLRRDKK